MADVTVYTERVDDIPLLISQQQAASRDRQHARATPWESRKVECRRIDHRLVGIHLV